MGNNRFGTIIQIGDVLVSEDVVLEFFACDYPVCKGCCCIMIVCPEFISQFRIIGLF
jgi:hypothetical protein